MIIAKIDFVTDTGKIEVYGKFENILNEFCQLGCNIFELVRKKSNVDYSEEVAFDEFVYRISKEMNSIHKNIGKRE